MSTEEEDWDELMGVSVERDKDIVLVEKFIQWVYSKQIWEPSPSLEPIEEDVSDRDFAVYIVDGLKRLNEQFVFNEYGFCQLEDTPLNRQMIVDYRNLLWELRLNMIEQQLGVEVYDFSTEESVEDIARSLSTVLAVVRESDDWD